MTRAMTPKEWFDRDTAEHQMTILHDDGVYRHVRFAQPGTSMMHWDLVTWPGHLCIDGDLDSFTFSREHDMFGFFAMDRGRINPHYWAEKITNRSVQTRVYEPDKAKARIIEAFLEQRHLMSAPAGPAWRSLREEVLDEFTLGDESLIRDALARWSFTDVDSSERWEFSDTWEWDLREWDYHYLMACYAIAWGIQKYREAAAEKLVAA
ncbi:hypothetical protein [Rhodococcus qingshengii]|uniref:hypothetical protein n=1 Tax=Rhodococcus qingshengii TaxID=334542 RepID=UPI001C8C4AE7|nr:hypothetical protein [Rhodococcus qingshengii]MBX9150041.1 hypothetical protein [Rhodococcus qingshengii]